MIRNFWFFVGSFLYMELVYHLSCFGFKLYNPLFAVFLWIAFSGVSALLTGFMRKKKNRTVFWILLSVEYLLFASQLVYMKIFRQPLLVAAVTNGGKDAVTNYWREALFAILKASGWLLLLAVPFGVAGFMINNRNLILKSHTYRERIKNVMVLTGGILGYVAVVFTGYFFRTDYFEEYSGFYDPVGIISEYGAVPAIVRDVLGDAFPEERPYKPNKDVAVNSPGTETTPSTDVTGGETITSGGEPDATPEPTPEPLDTSPNVLPIDFESLAANADNKKIASIAETMQSMTPTNRNEYTGMFEGYNLIYLTAEGFSPQAVDEKLTPTLYKLIHSGFVFENYYTPLWQTSTSDGEYVNCTGLIPDKAVFHAKKCGCCNAVYPAVIFCIRRGEQLCLP